jgi:hypothetical protein
MYLDSHTQTVLSQLPLFTSHDIPLAAEETQCIFNRVFQRPENIKRLAKGNTRLCKAKIGTQDLTFHIPFLC